MFKLAFLILLYFLNFFYYASGCGYFHKMTTSYLNSVADRLPEIKYSWTREDVDGFLAPVKYHPTVFLQKHTILETPLKSACVRCGICLAVAEKLEQILKFALKSSISLQDFDEYLSSQLLRPICDFAFERFQFFLFNLNFMSFTFH